MRAIKEEERERKRRPPPPTSDPPKKCLFCGEAKRPMASDRYQIDCICRECAVTAIKMIDEKLSAPASQ